MLQEINTDRPAECMAHGIFRVEKFREGESEPFEVLEFVNAYTNAGGAALLDLLIGAGGTAFNNTNAHIGVGDSSIRDDGGDDRPTGRDEQAARRDGRDVSLALWSDGDVARVLRLGSGEFRVERDCALQRLV